METMLFLLNENNHWNLIFYPIWINLVPKYSVNCIFYENDTKHIFWINSKGSKLPQTPLNPSKNQNWVIFINFWPRNWPKNGHFFFLNIFFFIFYCLRLLLWIFWYHIFKNWTKIELTVFFSPKYSKYSWLAIVT